MIDIAALRQKRAEKIDRMDGILSAATNETRELSAVEDTAYVELRGEVESLAKQVKQAEEVLALKASTAQPILLSEETAAQARGNTFKTYPQAARGEKTEPGIAFARIVRCLVMAKGQTSIAANIAENKFGDFAVAKALASGDGSAGGFLVSTEQSSEIIELLRAKAVVRRAGARVMPMQGSIDIPRVTSGSNASYVGENQNISKTEPAFGNLKATERKLAAIVPISNDLIRLSNPKADALVRDDLVQSLALTEDTYFLRGLGGGNSPKGMRYWANAANITATAGTSAANIETDLKNLIRGLEGNNVGMTTPVWLMSPRTKNALWVLRDTNGNLVFPEIRDDRLWGYPVYWSNQIPTNLGAGSESEIYFADMADVVIAENENFLLDVSDTAAYHDGSNVVAAFSQDQTVIRVIARHDLIVRHDYSVAVKTAIAY